MTEVKCNKCKRMTEIESEDMWEADLEDCADETLVFRFTGYCENEQGDEECGHVIEIIRYAKLQSHIDIEQEE